MKSNQKPVNRSSEKNSGDHRSLIVISALTLISLFATSVLISESTALAQDAPPFSNTINSFRDCKLCSEMVKIPSGTFLMGATKEEYAGVASKYLIFYKKETPRHRVQVKAFAIAKYDVTRAQFSVFARETGFKEKSCKVYDGNGSHVDPDANWSNPGFPQKDNDPVVCVSWNDAQQYVTWLNGKLKGRSQAVYRLPTEAEWEYAARAGTDGPTYWAGQTGDTCKFANVRDEATTAIARDGPRVECNDGFIYTSPVGMFSPNQWDLFDMLGNVYQWVEDCEHIGYYAPPLSGRSIATPDCSLRVHRGASWATIPFGIRSANRTGSKVDSRDNTLGFRLAADLK